MAVLTRPQLDGSFDVTERLLPKIGCREWVELARDADHASVALGDRYSSHTAR
jgi:hypothetical protein